MKRFVAFAAIATVALVVVAMPAFAIAGVNGTAFADNTILNVKVGSTVVKLGTDLAESLNTATLKAHGKFVTGTVGDAQLLGGAERTATTASNSGSKNIGTGTKSIAGLASINITSGKISTTVANAKINSAVDFVLGNVNALSGLVTVGTTDSSTDSSVGTTSSVVSRDVTIGAVNVLDLRSLLDQLGIDPLAMACAAIASTGAALGVDTAAACATLTSVEDAIDDATAGIGTTETVVGTLETALAPLCAVAELVQPGICGTITSQIDSLQADIDAIQADPGSTCAVVGEALDTVTGALDTIIATLNGLTGGLLGDLSALIAPVTSQLDALDTVEATLTSTCNQLLGMVDELLDTPLLSLSLINVAMDLAAKQGPTAAATGTIGALKVGNLTVVDANDLVALGSQLNAAIDAVETALDTVFDATGLGLTAPTLDLLKVTTSKGKNSAGSYFANAAMTVAHLGLPSAVVDLPVNNPLGVLGGLGSFAPAAVHMAAVTTPAVSVDAGVFSGAATHRASSTNNGDQLPVTGASDSAVAFAGMLTLIGAGLIRRVTKVF